MSNLEENFTQTFTLQNFVLKGCPVCCILFQLLIGTGSHKGSSEGDGRGSRETEGDAA